MTKNRPLSNKELIDILKEVLAAMEVKEVNRFRIRAYQNVIASIESLTKSVHDMWKYNSLDEISGVGTTLKGHFDELFTTGSVKDFDEIKGDLPQGMFSLIGLRGIGAKKAFKLATAFDLQDRSTALDDLKKHAEKGEIRTLEGFAEKSEKDILEAITESKVHKTEKERLLLNQAEEISSRLINYLLECEDIEKATALGSLRRRNSTVGDLDIAIATSNIESALDYYLEYPEIGEVLNRGKSGARVVLTTDVQVDLRVISADSYGSMLQYFTGSKMHNVILRTYALSKGHSLSEYGIKTNGKLKKFAEEADFYDYLGLQHVPPELRQGKNEVELAAANKLPALVTISDIKGDLHTHTDFSDGVNTLEEMVTKAKSLGYQYYGITDHAPSVVSRGYDEVKNIISNQLDHIEQLNEANKGLTLLLGYEVDILKDANLNMPDEFLAMLDYSIASIHTSFDLPRKETTKRLLSAIENPYVRILGHPTGRLINQRPSLDVDWEVILEACIEHDTILEINSQPSRLDLPADLVYEAREKGLKFIISTDAHELSHLDLMHYGIDVARRGWCTSDSILNTLPIDKFLRQLKGKKS